MQSVGAVGVPGTVGTTSSAGPKEFTGIADATGAAGIPGATAEANCATQIVRAGHHLLWSTKEVAEETPSRRDGVSDQVERTERFAACQFARNAVKELLGPHQEEACRRAQMLACLYVQLFFMFRSLQQEDSKVVATAAAFLACKVADVPRRMRDLLRTHNVQRTRDGDPELAEEQQKPLRDRLLRIELLLLRIICFDFDIATGMEEVDSLADRLLTGLTRSNVFRDWALARSEQPVAAAAALKPQVVLTAQRFLNDAFLGMGPLLFPPRVIAAGAVVFAARYVIRKMPMPMNELCRLFEDSEVHGQLEKASEEILKVFKLSSAKGGGVVPAGSAASAARGAIATPPPTRPGAAGMPGVAAAGEPAAVAGAVPQPLPSNRPGPYQRPP